MTLTGGTAITSIIIPTVNQVEIVKNCIDTLINHTFSSLTPYEIIVIDDGSSPEIQRRLRESLSSYPVRLITKERNTGFAATVNQAAAACKGKYLCLVNSDVTFIQPNWLGLMLNELKQSKVGVVGARLLYPDGRIQHGGIIYLPNGHTFTHEFHRQPSEYGPARRTREVLGVTGALMLVDKYLWDRLGGMDERFFVSLEDVDFCLRVWEAGWKVIYAGKAVAVHYEGFTRGNSLENKDPYWLEQERKSIAWFFEKWRHKTSFFRRFNRPTHRLVIHEMRPQQARSELKGLYGGSARVTARNGVDTDLY